MAARDRIVSPSTVGIHDLMFEKEIRDPLYQYIHITKLESTLIDTPEFQRLDRLYQNPVVRFVYPNGTHTRKAHSLGVMHLYHKALLKLLYHQSSEFRAKFHPLFFTPTVQIDTSTLDNLGQLLSREWWNSKEFIEILQVGRISALLHDIGHGLFSHLFEQVCEEVTGDKKFFDHEKISAKIVEERFSRYLVGSIKPEDILTILRKREGERWFPREILDGPFDVDKLDYINRDSYHCGTKEYGTVDFERIIDGFRVKGEKLLISKSALGAVISGFNALQSTYAHIYYHKTCRVFDHMIMDALRLVPEHVKEVATSLDVLLDTDDVSFLRDIKHKSSSSSDGTKFSQSWEIIKDVLNRNLRYTVVHTHQITLDMVHKITDELSAMKKKYQERYKELKLIFDYTGDVKGLRIDPVRTFEWLLEPNIINEKENSPKPLKEVSESYYNTLRQYQVLVHILVDRNTKKSGTQDHCINKAVGEIKDEIERMERMKKI